MGLFDRAMSLLGAANGVNVSGPVANPSNYPISSPWQNETLNPVLWSDLFDLSWTPVGRLDALRVPSISRARAILHAVIGRADLKAYRDGQPLPNEQQPTWLYRSDTGISPYQRKLAMLDDHIFDDATLLVVDRGSRGNITDAVHLPRSKWFVDADGKINVDIDGTPRVADSEEVIWIPGPGPGLLTVASQLVKSYLDLERANAGRVRNPTPTTVLKQKDDTDLEQAEVKQVLDSIATARRNPDGTIMFVPHQYEVEFHGTEAVDLFDKGRNAVRIDVANYFNMPSGQIDGSLSTASLTYQTTKGMRDRLFDETVPYWASPIEQGLSLDNVVPRGQYIRFDFGDSIELPQTTVNDREALD